MRIFYIPFGIVSKRVSKKLGNSLFVAIWGRVDNSVEAPGVGMREASVGKVIAGQAIQAATMAASAAAVERASMRTFHHLFGIWPAKKPKRKDTEDAKVVDAVVAG